jgi:hypothetical protein
MMVGFKWITFETKGLTLRSAEPAALHSTISLKGIYLAAVDHLDIVFF